MDIINESKIEIGNANHLGINLTKYYIKYGEEVAKQIKNRLIKDDNSSIAFICGLGGNAGDALAVAYYLYEQEVKNITIYLVGRANKFLDPITEKIWNEVILLKSEISIKQDCYAEDIKQHDIIVEGLTGEGLVGNSLNKRFKDVINRISHFNSKIIAIDKPTSHYKPDSVFSINYPKTQDAEVIQIPYPEELDRFCGPGEKLALWQPNKKTHTSKNGNLLIITDEEIDKTEITKITNDYHANIKLFAPTNKEILSVSNSELENVILEADSILLYEIDYNYVSSSMIHKLLNFSNKKFVFSSQVVNDFEINLKEISDSIVFIEKSHAFDILGKNDVGAIGGLRRFAIENRIIAFLQGMQNSLVNKEGKTKYILSRKSYLQILLETSIYSTKNDLWLSLRAAMTEN